MGGGESKPEDLVIDDVNLDDDDDGEPTIEKLQKKLDLLKQDCVIEKKLPLFLTMIRLYGDKHNIKDVGKVTEGINEIIELFKTCLNNPKSIFYMDEETIDDLSFSKYLKKVMKGIIPLLIIIPFKERIKGDLRTDPYAKKEKILKLDNLIKKYVERVEAFDDKNLLNYVYDHSQEFPEVFRTIHKIFNVYEDNNRVIFEKISSEVKKDLNEVLEDKEVLEDNKLSREGGKMVHKLKLIKRIEKTENDFFEKMITEENSEKNGVLSILDNRDLVVMDQPYENDKKKFIDKLADETIDMLDRGGDGIININSLKIEMGGKIEVSPKLGEMIKIFYENELLLGYKERLRKRWLEYYEILKKSGSKEGSPESSPVMEGMQNYINKMVTTIPEEILTGEALVKQKKCHHSCLQRQGNVPPAQRGAVSDDCYDQCREELRGRGMNRLTINDCLGGCTDNHSLRRLIKKEDDLLSITPKGLFVLHAAGLKKIKELKERIKEECSDQCREELRGRGMNRVTINCMDGCLQKHPSQKKIKEKSALLRASAPDPSSVAGKTLINIVNREIDQRKKKMHRFCSDQCREAAKDTAISSGGGAASPVALPRKRVSRNLVALQQKKNPTQEEPDIISWRENREFGSLIKGDLGHKHLVRIDKEIERQIMDNFRINKDIQEKINGLQEGFIGSIYRGQRNPLVVFCVFAFILILSILLISKIESILK